MKNIRGDGRHFNLKIKANLVMAQKKKVIRDMYAIFHNMAGVIEISIPPSDGFFRGVESNFWKLKGF